MDELTKIALVGTSKYSGDVSSLDDPASALVAGLGEDDRERSLLLRCGTQAIYGLAGRRSIAGIATVAPAADETKKTASRKLADLLESAITEKENGLLLDFLSQMRERDVVLPPELLPVLLEMKDQALSRGVIPLLGERGAWLCRQNPEWSSFLTPAGDDFGTDLEAIRRALDEGTVDERSQALMALRRRDPVAGRDWVAQTMPREKHGNRLMLVKALETGLNAGDEPFFGACLDDRSPAVGQAAAWLLGRLPESALAKRMRSRAAAMITIEKNGKTADQVKLVCTPPAEIEPDWVRDGFTRKAPSGVGIRAFWAEHLVESVPPSHWTCLFGLNPRSLLKDVADETYADSVVSGWTKAAVEFSKWDTASAEWLLPLWQYHLGVYGEQHEETPSAESASDDSQLITDLAGQLDKHDRTIALMPMRQIVSVLAADLAEEVILNLVEAAPTKAGDIADMLLPALARPWSSRLSIRFLATIRDRLQSEADEAAYRLATKLGEIVFAIHPDTFPLALEPWRVTGRDESTTWFAAAIPREIDKFVATIEKRQGFLKELNA
jgi:Family of unknown function (DUF5691)